MMRPMAVKTRAVRKDVLRNRALLLEAADAVVREHGMQLSLNAVAHHAGVGVGTVYRHFPDRAALISAMFEQRMEQVCGIIADHLDDDDPVLALRATIFDICRMQAGDRGVWEVVAAGNRDAETEIVPNRLLPLARTLVSRANASGRLRTRFEVNDLPVLLWTGGALNSYLGAVSSTAWLRYLELLFDSFLLDDDPARTPALHKAPSVEQMDAARRGWPPPA